MPELFHQSVAALADQLAAKKISATELTQVVIARTKGTEPRVHAFNSLDEPDALAQAAASDARRATGQTRGPLDGIPVALKDVIAVKDQPLTASSRMLANFVSPYDATVSTRLKEAGAVLYGRAQLRRVRDGLVDGELGVSSPPAIRGIPRGCPGGSSGGSAAALAAGEAIATLGSDTGGSIRQPAALLRRGRAQAHVRPRVALTGWSRMRRRSTRSGRLRGRWRMPRLCSGRSPATTSGTRPPTTLPMPDYRAGIAEPAADPWRLGIPKEYFGEGPRSGDCRGGRAGGRVLPEARGCEIREVSLPHTQYCLDTYYIIATAEASSNLARLRWHPLRASRGARRRTSSTCTSNPAPRVLAPR